MKFVTKLNEIQAELLSSRGKVNSDSYVELVRSFKASVREYLENNTGFDLNPITGLSRSAESTCDSDDDLVKSLSLEEGDYLLEFDFPSDFMALITKEDFDLLNSPRVKISNKVISDVLVIDKPLGTEGAIAFVPCLFLRFCTGFCKILDGEKVSNLKLKSVEDFKSIYNF